MEPKNCGLAHRVPFQRAIYEDIVGSLGECQRFLQEANDGVLSGSVDHSWRKYRVLFGKPGTGKSQVLIRAINKALRRECVVLLAAPVALLGQGYCAIFGDQLECDTLHASFQIPVVEGQ